MRKSQDQIASSLVSCSTRLKWSRLTELDIDGDASFSMTLTELSTAAQFNIGVKILVLNNEEQGTTHFLLEEAVTDQLQVW